MLHIRVGIADLGGELLDSAQRSWDIARGPAETFDQALEMLDAMLAKHPEVPTWAVAVGLPGPVDFETGRPVAPPIMPGWNGFDVRRQFETRFDAPVWVDNDVNLLTFSERRRRRGETPTSSTARSAPGSARVCSRAAGCTGGPTAQPATSGMCG